MVKSVVSLLFAAVLCVIMSPAAFASSEVLIDTTKPVINSVSIDKQGQTLEVGDTITVSIDAVDDTGIEKVSDAFLRCMESEASSGNMFINLLSRDFVFNSSTGRYECSIEIDTPVYPGTWIVGEVQVTDYAGNEASYDNYDGTDTTLQFEISNDGTDIVKPVINSVSIDKQGQTVEVGDTITVSIDAVDDTGIEEVFAYLKCNESEASSGNGAIILLHHDFVFNSSTGRYEGSVGISTSVYPGTWFVYEVQVTDYAGNEASYENYSGTDTTTQFEISSTYAIEKSKTLKYIELDTPPNPVYRVGDSISAWDITVTAVYWNGATEDVTYLALLSGFSSDTTGEKEVTVSYAEKGVTKEAKFTARVLSADNFELARELEDLQDGMVSKPSVPNAVIQAMDNYLANQTSLTVDVPSTTYDDGIPDSERMPGSPIDSENTYGLLAAAGVNGSPEDPDSVALQVKQLSVGKNEAFAFALDLLVEGSKQQLLSPVIITMKAPEDYVYKTGEYIKHIKNSGAVEWLRFTYDAENQTISFRVNEFSEFVITVKPRSTNGSGVDESDYLVNEPPTLALEEAQNYAGETNPATGIAFCWTPKPVLPMQWLVCLMK